MRTHRTQFVFDVRVRGKSQRSREKVTAVSSPSSFRDDMRRRRDPLGATYRHGGRPAATPRLFNRQALGKPERVGFVIRRSRVRSPSAPRFHTGSNVTRLGRSGAFSNPKSDEAGGRNLPAIDRLQSATAPLSSEGLGGMHDNSGAVARERAANGAKTSVCHTRSQHAAAIL
jgi:hypothetical protein